MKKHIYILSISLLYSCSFLNAYSRSATIKNYFSKPADVTIEYEKKCGSGKDEEISPGGFYAFTLEPNESRNFDRSEPGRNCSIEMKKVSVEIETEEQVSVRKSTEQSRLYYYIRPYRKDFRISPN